MVWPIQLYGVELFDQNYQYPFDRRLHVKSGEKWSSSFREENIER